MELRPIAASDVPGAIALVRDTLAEFGLAFGKGSSTDEQLYGLPGSYRDAGGEFFIALDGPSIVGTAGVMKLDGGVYELRKMYLSSALRGRGVGKLLLMLCLHFCREQKGRSVVLDTTDAMKSAIAFYERNGFVRDDAQIRGSRCSRGYRLDL